LILRISADLGPTQGVGVVQLLVLGYRDARAIIGETQQEVSQRVVIGERAGVAGHASQELKAAARVADAGTDGWLKVVEVEVIPGEAILGSVSALGPAQVDVGGELVVAEQERICTVGIANRCKG
jgi:hypothetical protein